MTGKPVVLVVDDEANVRRVLAALLEQAGYQAATAASAEEALGQVGALDPDVLLTDLRMGAMDGMALLSRVRELYPEIPVVLLTAHGSIATAVEAMKRGAFDFLTKPFERDHVLDVVGRALGQARRSREDFQGPLAEGARCGLVGVSAALEAVRRVVERVAPTPSTVLITGESGTGKEVVADALHRLSPRSAAPFVRINGAAIPEALCESELFGHERGAFTGAERSKPGRFELADGGTLFLDEVGELPLAVQAKLLRVLEDRAVDRVGGTGPRKVDVRLVAATNRDLDEAVRAGRFRGDLLYRLRVVEVRLPALRERPEDVAPLLAFFLQKHARRLGRASLPVADAALAALRGYDWPGNVRELENAVERALLLAPGPSLESADFGLAPAARGGAATPGPEEGLRAAARSAERRAVEAALAACGGNVTHAAERLGLSRRGLQLKLKALGLR